MAATVDSLILDEAQWQRFSLAGFLDLGRVLTSVESDALRERADDLAASGRELGGLEHDELFRPLVAHQLFLEICARMYAPHAPVAVLRAEVITEDVAAWRQGEGAGRELDRDPLVTVLVALDDATAQSGAIEAIRGSHRRGLLADEGGTLSDESAAIHCDPGLVVPLELACGHALLLHNWLIHRLAAGRSSPSRRVFSGCHIDGRTISLLTGEHFPLVAGAVDESPYPYIGQLENDRVALAERCRAAEERTRSLESEVSALRERCELAEARVRSLEVDPEGPQVEPESAQDAPQRSERVRLPARAAHWLRSLLH
jgi:hypothetical protein